MSEAKAREASVEQEKTQLAADCKQVTGKNEELTRQLTESQSELAAASGAQQQLQAEIGKLREGAGNAEKELQAKCDKLQCDEAQLQQDLKKKDRKLRGANASVDELKAELEKVHKLSEEGNAREKEVADAALTKAQEQMAKLTEEKSKLQAKSELLEKEVAVCGAAVTEQQRKTENAVRLTGEAKEELKNLQKNGDSRAKMLQGCVDALETELAEEKRKSEVVAQLEKEKSEISAELEETKHKLTTLWGQFLGSK